MLALAALAALNVAGAPAQDAVRQGGSGRVQQVPVASLQPARARMADSTTDAAGQPSTSRGAAPAPVAKPPVTRPTSVTRPIGITVQVIPATPTVYVNFLGPPIPNPAAWSTVIRYSLAKSTNVSIRVYSITGQEAAKLVEWHQGPGNYTLYWDGTGPHGRLPPGMYIYRMVAGSYVKSQRLVLMR